MTTPLEKIIEHATEIGARIVFKPTVTVEIHYDDVVAVETFKLGSLCSGSVEQAFMVAMLTIRLEELKSGKITP